MEETEASFRFVEGLVPEIEYYVRLQQPRTLQHAVQVAKKNRFDLAPG